MDDNFLAKLNTINLCRSWYNGSQVNQENDAKKHQQIAVLSIFTFLNTRIVIHLLVFVHHFL